MRQTHLIKKDYTNLSKSIKNVHTLNKDIEQILPDSRRRAMKRHWLAEKQQTVIDDGMNFVPFGTTRLAKPQIHKYNDFYTDTRTHPKHI